MTRDPLNDLHIATPCRASWADMTGDQRQRFCQACKLHVYNLSAMTHREALSLIEKAEGRVCVRLYRRKDGTVITRDCPVGRAGRLRRNLALLAGQIGALFLVACGAMYFARSHRSTTWLKPIREVLRIPDPRPPVVQGMMERVEPFKE